MRKKSKKDFKHAVIFLALGSTLIGGFIYLRHLPHANRPYTAAAIQKLQDPYKLETKKTLEAEIADLGLDASLIDRLVFECESFNTYRGRTVYDVNKQCSASITTYKHNLNYENTKQKVVGAGWQFIDEFDIPKTNSTKGVASRYSKNGYELVLKQDKGPNTATVEIRRNSTNNENIQGL